MVCRKCVAAVLLSSASWENPNPSLSLHILEQLPHVSAKWVRPEPAFCSGYPIDEATTYRCNLLASRDIFTLGSGYDVANWFYARAVEGR